MSSDDSLSDSLLERLRLSSEKPTESLDNLRLSLTKLHNRLITSDKVSRDRLIQKIANDPHVFSILLSVIETVYDSISLTNALGILHICVSPKSGPNRAQTIKQLVAMNTTQALLRMVMLHGRDSAYYPEQVIHELIWVLSQIAPKDSKFSVKVRLFGVVKTFHAMLRFYFAHSRMLYPILLVMKSLTRNQTTTTFLVKDGVVTSVDKIIGVLGVAGTPKLRLTLDLLGHLTRNKQCCTRVLKTGLLSTLLKMLEHWEKYEGKIRLKLCSAILTTIQHLCVLKNGRNALKANNGLNLLHKFSRSCPEDKTFDTLLSKVCGIITLCLEKQDLPVDNIQSPACFPLPTLNGVKIDFEGLKTITSAKQHCRDSDDDSEDDDDDDDKDKEDGDEDSDEKDSDNDDEAPSVPVRRNVEDLERYGKFFTEIEMSYQNTEVKNTMYEGSHRDRRRTCSAIRGDCLANTKRILNTSQMVASLSENSFEQKSNERRLSSSSDDFFVPRNRSPGDIFYGDKCMRSDTRPSLQKDMKNLPARQGQSICSFEQQRSTRKLDILNKVPKYCSAKDAYAIVASQVHSVIPFVKVAYPDLMGGESVNYVEPLNVKDRKVCRAKLLTCVDRGLCPESLMNNVVYDLDALLSIHQTQGRKKPDRLINWDERRLGEKIEDEYLKFESRFESGNLRKVIQIGPNEYDLILMPDVNSDRHHNWFYFEVSNMESSVPYVFNIINCERQNSQFNFGMKPVLYSVREATLGRPGWIRAGTDICYYRNSYQNTTSKNGKSYLTATFTVYFPHSSDVCYMAYHYPYTYSQLLTQLYKLTHEMSANDTIFYAEPLCTTLNGNEAPVLTITAPDNKKSKIMDRQVIFLTARVHPGESNSSWVMQGTLKLLLSKNPCAVQLCNQFIFKIIPMLNIEGVVNGCHRCGLTDEDLNRRWSRPNPSLHPVIYHAKGLIEYMVHVLNKRPFVFCDYHGHSRRKNVFLYGCSLGKSWNEQDRLTAENPEDYLALPQLMDHFSPSFSLTLCSFTVERSRESTARVTVWREFGIARSYTMESSYCGVDQGPFKGYHMGTPHLQQIGAQFCEALSFLEEESSSMLVESNSDRLTWDDLEFDTGSDSMEISDSSDDNEEYG